MGLSPSEVTEIIEREMAGNWSLSNAHGVDLKKCLVPPAKRVYNDSFDEGKTLELWLVLEEDPVAGSGYKIVFDEETRKFGLAVSAVDRDLFLGFYGSFLETLEGM